MIAAVTGILTAKGADWIQIYVKGVTFHISVPSSLAQETGEQGQAITVHTRLIIRDDEPQLYGFPTLEALKLFHMLTRVSGIGPRIALSLLSARTPEALARAIQAGDTETLTKVPGIGKKNAARIILEIKGILEKEGFLRVDTSTSFVSDAEVENALTALGYTITEARRAVNATEHLESEVSLEDRVRLALNHLARNN